MTMHFSLVSMSSCNTHMPEVNTIVIVLYAGIMVNV